MLFDHRTYKCRPGTVPLQAKLYEEYGFKPQVRHLGEPLAWLIAESGELNTFVHIWAYRDAADRAQRRAAMQADPEWRDYVKRSGEAGYLIEQRTCLMTPATFMRLPDTA